MVIESSLKKFINNLVPRVSLEVRAGGRGLQRLESELPNTSTSETVEIDVSFLKECTFILISD